jgi:diaminopimelate decarboxylase
MRVLLDTALAAKASLPDLHFVDVGGGIGTPYRPSDVAVNVTVLGEAISAAFADFQRSYCDDAIKGARPQLILEPGRFFVAESGFLLARINTLKDIGGRCFAGVDTGANELIVTYLSPGIRLGGVRATLHLQHCALDLQASTISSGPASTEAITISAT